jgi:hypothetical protein
MPEDGSGMGVAVEDQMEIRSANPALRHLDQQVAGTGFGNGHILHSDPAVPVTDRRWHQT